MIDTMPLPKYMLVPAYSEGYSLVRCSYRVFSFVTLTKCGHQKILCTQQRSRYSQQCLATRRRLLAQYCTVFSSALEAVAHLGCGSG